jgi:DNA-binding CsgD family transcriptional regulator
MHFFKEELMDQVMELDSGGALKSDGDLVRESIAITIERNIKPILKELQELSLKENLSDNFTNKIRLIEGQLDDINTEFYKKIENLRVKLTNQENKICHLIKEGYAPRDMGEILGISYHTINVHIRHIRKKLGLVNKRVTLKNYFDHF